MATIQSGLPIGIGAVREAFGEDRVTLHIVDRRNFDQPKLLEGWENSSILEAEGNYEQIKQRLAGHLEARRRTLSDAAYRQAVGLSPERPAKTNRPGTAGARDATGDGPRPPPEDSETSRVTPRLERACAFEQLPSDDAIDQHPELRPLYEALKAFREELTNRFPDDSYSRERYLAKARAEILDKLESGAIPQRLEATRLDPDASIDSPPPQRDLDRD